MTTVIESESETEYLQKVNKAMIQLHKNTTATRKANKPKSKIVPWNKGKHWSDEIKKKQSKSMLQYWQEHPERREELYK